MSDTMQFDPDDPRLSAYVLDELQPDERAQVEALLAASAEARRFVAELRSSADLLHAELDAEAVASPGLDQDRRAALHEEIGGRSRPGGRRRLQILGVLLAAAAVVVATTLVLRERPVERAEGKGDLADSARLKMERTPPAPQLRTLVAESASAIAPTESIQTIPARGKAGVRKPSISGRRFRHITEIKTKGTGDSLWFLHRTREQDGEEGNTEAYDHIAENDFRKVADAPLSTFSIDVDTASYANIRRFLGRGQLPPPDAVRIEELINYFDYEDSPPREGLPFGVTLEVAQCPWKLDHRLVRIGLKGRAISAQRPASNLVFLLDVSGSMQPPNKLPLLRRAMRLLVDALGENDRVAIVVYAGAAGLVLPSTSCDHKEKIRTAIERLEAGGSTNGGAGIALAYETALSNFIEGGSNRVILCTDGDFNVGTTDRGSLVRLVQEKAASGVFLSVLGFGMGNIKDARLEELADKGNGNYAYIDTLAEARKVLVREMGATLVTIAKDVKIQVEFNPARVASYRLIGYENRLLKNEDFNDDTKDAGEIGAGQSVCALYEITPAGAGPDTAGVDPLRYQRPAQPSEAASSAELLSFKLRYKQPDEKTSRLIEETLADGGKSFDQASTDLRFAAAVAAFGMILRHSKYRGSATLDTVHELAGDALGADPHGDRHGFLELIEKARNRQ